jgi:hypothetical protein
VAINEDKEIKKVRDEAAKYRTQLAPYKEAFGDLEPEAISWMLDTIKMVNSDGEEAGKRFASLAYANLGEENFKEWYGTVIADEPLVENTDIGDNEDMTEQNTSGQVDMTEWATGLENRLMGAIGEIEKKNEERAANEQRHVQLKNIQNIANELGYDPNSWEGKMLLQVASGETNNDLDIRERLVAAHEIVSERIIKKESPEETSTPPILGDAPVLQTLNVPATGGQVGGGGIPDINGEDPIRFSDANNALNSLLKSEIGA